jgi:hypothetical protein
MSTGITLWIVVWQPEKKASRLGGLVFSFSFLHRKTASWGLNKKESKKQGCHLVHRLKTKAVTWCCQ